MEGFHLPVIDGVAGFVGGLHERRQIDPLCRHGLVEIVIEQIQIIGPVLNDRRADPLQAPADRLLVHVQGVHQDAVEVKKKKLLHHFSIVSGR